MIYKYKYLAMEKLPMCGHLFKMASGAHREKLLPPFSRR